MQYSSVNLGLGLIGIGRKWGYRFSGVPGQGQVEELLTTALSLGITLFDTAPSYGISEARLGNFLAKLDPNEYREVIISTKVGEHWDSAQNTSYVDQSYDAMRDSIDRSLSHLGRIDILQVHKANPAVLSSIALQRTLEWAKSAGVQQFGVSVSDPITGRIACADPKFSFVQFPYNASSTALLELIDDATQAGKCILINRPFNMGQEVVNASQETGTIAAQRRCYEFILRRSFRGFILTGTTSATHLRDNVRAFRDAANSTDDNAHCG